MSNALLSDVEARAQRRRTQTSADRLQDLVRHALRRSSAAADPADARRWLQRAHRLLPKDGTIAITLASAFLHEGDLGEAARLFEALTETYGTAEAYAAAATCAHLRGDATEARTALAAALRCSVPTPTLHALANAVAGATGWCGLTLDGAIVTGAVQPRRARLDGVALRSIRRLPPGWQSASRLEVAGADGPLLGSPLPIRPFVTLEGFVEAKDGGIQGWAWFPADLSHDPVLHIAGPLGASSIVATVPAEGLPSEAPLARRRHFALAAESVAALGEKVAIRGPDGRHLLGSPLAPGLEQRALADPARNGFAPAWADLAGVHTIRRFDGAGPPVDVVIPVYRGLEPTLACVRSVLASLAPGSATRVIVVDDCSPEPPLVEALQALVTTGRIELLRLPDNRGFPGAANAGLRAAAGRDAVLLNSDTLVPPGWLERLRTAAYSAPDIGTATPLSNDGTILSVPDPRGGNPAPNLAGTIAADRRALKANGTATVDLPVGVGFCLYLRRDCLDDVGLLREDLFAQGYGEENDLCLRARQRGWRSVAALGVFVAHASATSFGPAREHLVRRNGAILERLHPGYAALVARHVAADPLGPARLRMDLLRWAAGRQRSGAVIVLTHAGGGGVDRVVADRIAAVMQAGQRAVVLRPHRMAAGEAAVRVDDGSGPFPGLVFPMPSGLAALAKLLRPDRPIVLERHHMLGHHGALDGLAALLAIETVDVVHDYARFCPRIALVSTERRYCGEPEVAGCEACIADLGSLLEDDPPVRLLLERSAASLAQASRIVAPSADAATRLARHFPSIRVDVTPWEDDTRWPPLAPAPPRTVRRVAVVGAIGVEKGFEVLLACSRDARARGLPLEFIVVGYTADDERLMESGPVFVTGPFNETEAVALVRAQAAHLAFVPSVWPETWCFALSRAWEAGLPAVVFDIGAPAARVRQTGHGWVLPFGIGPAALNDVLLRLAPEALASQCPAHST